MNKSRFKEVLIQEGITQAELSRLSKMASGTINKYANNILSPSDVTKSKIIKALNSYLKQDKYKAEDLFSPLGSA